MLKSSQFQPTPEQNCQPCEREDNFIKAVKWCTECEECLCTECVRFHRKSKYTRNHHVVDISCIEKFSAVVDQVCPQHSKLSLDLFCVDHDELCCRQCMTEKHRTCQKLLPIDVAARDVRSSTLLGATMEDIDTLFQTFLTIETEVNKEKQSANEQKKTALKGVAAIEVRMRQELEDSVKQLRQEIDKRCTENMQQMEKQTDFATKHKDIFKIKKEDVQHIIEHGSESQIFVLAHQLKMVIAKERSMCESFIQSAFTVDIKHTENQTFAITPASFGDIALESKPLEISMKYPNAQVSEMFKSIDQNKTLYFNSTFDFKLTQNIEIRGVAITEEDNVLICERSSQSVFLFSSSGQRLNVYKTKWEPYNICILRGLDEAVVTLPTISKIEFFCTSSMEYIRDVQCLSYPWGITATADEIIVGCRRKMLFFTRHGEAINVIDIPGLDFTGMCFVFPGDANRIMASCKHFYDVTRDGQIRYQHNFLEYRANGICVDRSKGIYIATRKSILRLSEDGEVLDNNVLDNKYDYGDLWGISFNRNFTKLYAASDNGKSLTVFDFK